MYNFYQAGREYFEDSIDNPERGYTNCDDAWDGFVSMHTHVDSIYLHGEGQAEFADGWNAAEYDYNNLTLTRAAEEVELKPNTLRAYVVGKLQPRLPAFKVGRAWIVKRTAFEAWLAARESLRNTPPNVVTLLAVLFIAAILFSL